MHESIIDELLPQVRHNCLVSDAGYWGYYSTCGLLLRLREQYRHEAGIAAGEPIPSASIGPWIEQREADWSRLEDAPLNNITINGQATDPFDTIAINALIEDEGFIYGGGHGAYMKPVFFLAELEGKESIGDYTVLMAGREMVRDLSIHPAMSRDGIIIARADMVHAMLCDRFDEFRGSKRAGMLGRAFTAYGADKDADEGALRKIATHEMQAFIRHEVGELDESARLGDGWEAMITALDISRTGLLMRGVKDALADTSQRGMLAHIIDTRNEGGLLLYVSSLTGLRYTLTQSVREAVKEAINWSAVDAAREASYERAAELATSALKLYESAASNELDTNLATLLASACPMK